MLYPSRVQTTRLLGLIEEGYLDKDQVILACLDYMSDRTVGEMAVANEFFEEEEEEDNDEQSAWYDTSAELR
jgi:hypothetical protein